VTDMTESRDDPPEMAADTDERSAVRARRLLWQSLTGRPTRGQAVVGVLLAALGFATAVQVRQTNTAGDFGTQRRADLVALIDSLGSATDRTQTQIDELEQSRGDLETSAQRRQLALEEGREQLEVLEILTGTVAATGPGITVIVRDIEGDDVAPVLLNGIEELRDAGAEAIEINDTVRVVASSAFTEEDGIISVDGVALRAPYVIDAIGAPGTLAEAMVFRGGFVESVQELDGTAEVQRADVVDVDSLHVIEPDEYARPTDR